MHLANCGEIGRTKEGFSEEEDRLLMCLFQFDQPDPMIQRKSFLATDAASLNVECEKKMMRLAPLPREDPRREGA